MRWHWNSFQLENVVTCKREEHYYFENGIGTRLRLQLSKYFVSRWCWLSIKWKSLQCNLQVFLFYVVQLFLRALPQQTPVKENNDKWLLKNWFENSWTFQAFIHKENVLPLVWYLNSCPWHFFSSEIKILGSSSNKIYLHFTFKLPLSYLHLTLAYLQLTFNLPSTYLQFTFYYWKSTFNLPSILAGTP